MVESLQIHIWLSLIKGVFPARAVHFCGSIGSLSFPVKSSLGSIIHIWLKDDELSELELRELELDELSELELDELELDELELLDDELDDSDELELELLEDSDELDELDDELDELELVELDDELEDELLLQYGSNATSINVPLLNVVL